jgi:cytochrome P450
LRSLNTVVYDLITQRRECGEDRGDVLSVLVHATDKQTEKPMTHQQLRDEVVTLLTGGGESTTSSLAWTWYLLGMHPEVEYNLHQELDRVLGGRVPTVNDIPQLVYTRMIIDEVLRLYPPLWLLMRRAVQDDEIEGYHIPKDTSLLWSAYLLHRHPDIWDDPEQFCPERFLPEQGKRRPHYGYIPFGGGPHICIGKTFALTEMTLIIATIAQRYRLELAPEQVIEPNPLLSLRPNKEICVYLRSRK